MRPERLDSLGVIEAPNGMWVDVRKFDYLPIEDATQDYGFHRHLMYLALKFPKNLTVMKWRTPLTPQFNFPQASPSELASRLVTRTRELELQNAELLSKVADSMRFDLEARAKRHLETYRKKRKSAQEVGDLNAAAMADQRVRALEALLEA